MGDAHRLCRLIWKNLHDGISYIGQRAEPARGQRNHARKNSLRRYANWAAKSRLLPHRRWCPRGNFQQSGCTESAILKPLHT